MIKIASSVKIAFMFPADIDTAFTYYSDIPRMVGHLKHIDLAPTESTPNDEFRLWYHTTKLGRSHVHVYCGVRLELDYKNRIIFLQPMEGFPPVQTKVTVNSTTTRGYYSSEGRFLVAGPDSTRIEYTLQLQATPPKPKGMQIVPGRIVDAVAQNITSTRMKEIAESFIDKSVQEFPLWRDARVS
jgi:hypothetical protein